MPITASCSLWKWAYEVNLNETLGLRTLATSLLLIKGGSGDQLEGWIKEKQSQVQASSKYTRPILRSYFSKQVFMSYMYGTWILGWIPVRYSYTT